MDDRAPRATRRSLRLGAALVGLLAVAAWPPPPARAQAESVTPAPVTTERPDGKKPRAKRSRGADRDARRSRDPLQWTDRDEFPAARDVDPRFFEYRKLLTAIAAGKDSVSVAFDARERASLYASVSDLARLEDELNRMESLLDAQRQRLVVLQGDFAGRQRTELDVIVTGAPMAGVVDSVRVTLDDGTSVGSRVTETQLGSLQHGGALEVFRGLVEPREQVIEVALMGEGWSATGHGFVRVLPQRDRLTFVKLDLSGARPALGMGSVVAGTWQLDPGVPGVRSVPTAEATRDRP